MLKRLLSRQYLCKQIFVFNSLALQELMSQEFTNTIVTHPKIMVLSVPLSQQWVISQVYIIICVTAVSGQTLLGPQRTCKTTFLIMKLPFMSRTCMCKVQESR